MDLGWGFTHTNNAPNSLTTDKLFKKNFGTILGVRYSVISLYLKYGQSDSTMRKVFSMHAANSGFISSISYGCMILPGVTSEQCQV